MSDASLRAASSLWIVVSLLSAVGRAQCANAWQPGDGIPGVRGDVKVIHGWDPDGAGPLQPWTVVAGTFDAAGQVAARNVAAWDPATATWSNLAGGVGATVEALVTMPNGDLVAAGAFVEAGGVTVHHVARWDGVGWSPFGTGVGGNIRSATVRSNGDLVVVGFFGSAGGVPADGAALWDGTSWSALGPQANLSSVVAGSGGELYGMNSGPVQWNGTAWVPLGTGVTWLSLPQYPRMIVMPGGDLIVYRYSSSSAGTGLLSRWNGTAWSLIPPPPGLGFAGRLAVAGTGHLVAGSTSIRSWDGTTWTLIAERSDLVNFGVLPNGQLVAASRVNNGALTQVWHWSGSAWVLLGGGTDGPVNKVLHLPDGDLVAGGRFRMIGGVAANCIARWNGTTWSPLGTGFTESGASVSGVVAMPNGDLVVQGQFTQAGGVAVQGLARWDGSAWSAVGAPGLQGSSVSIGGILAQPSGDLIVGGRFTQAGAVPVANIARWDGVAWSPLGGGTNDRVSSLLPLPSGGFVASGSFTMAGGVAADYVARWDGSTWSAVGASPVPVRVVLVTASGDLVGTRGSLGASAEVVRLAGTTWTTLGTFDYGVSDVEELPDGDLVAAGLFLAVDGSPAQRVARFDGATWSPLGSGVGYASVADLAMDARRGELLLAGSFVSAGGLVSSYLARLTSTCAAASIATGLGCASSGGNNTLTAVTLPFVDATFQSRATGLPTVAIAATLLSFTPLAQGALPLASVFAQAQPGCDLLVAPDILGLVAAANGVADYGAFLPNTPPLVGLTFFHQMVPFEFDPQGNVVAITATNALTLTAGAF